MIPIYLDCISDHPHEECLFVTEDIQKQVWRLCIYTFEFSYWVAEQDIYLNRLQFELWRKSAQIDREVTVAASMAALEREDWI